MSIGEMPMEEKEACLGGSDADLAISEMLPLDVDATSEAEAAAALVDATGGMVCDATTALAWIVCLVF